MMAQTSPAKFRRQAVLNETNEKLKLTLLSLG